MKREDMLRIDQAYSYENSWSGFKWDTYNYNDPTTYTEEEAGWFTARIPILT